MTLCTSVSASCSEHSGMQGSTDKVDAGLLGRSVDLCTIRWKCFPRYIMVASSSLSIVPLPSLGYTETVIRDF